MAAIGGASGDVELVIKWCGKEFHMAVHPTVTVLHVKQQLERLTNVLPHRQKLLGLVKGKTAGDEATLESLAVSNPCRIMMMGSPESEILPEREEVDVPEVIDDFDLVQISREISLSSLPENRAKLQNRIDNLEIAILHPLRSGKKLLVLDLDYTLLDFKSVRQDQVSDVMRPYTHWFLEKVYPHYDLAAWSQTSWRWLELKMTEMGLFSSDKFHFSFVLDRSSMFPIISKARDGTDKKHEVKPLEFIWQKLPSSFNAANTIHIDDLAQNFALNPKNGLKISAYRYSPEAKASDKELLYMGYYLEIIASLPDLTAIDHREWRTTLQKHQEKN